MSAAMDVTTKEGLYVMSPPLRLPETSSGNACNEGV